MLMCFISVCAHAQLILLEEDESGVVETVQQAVTPQVQSTPAPAPAPQQQQIVAEEEENLFAPKQQAQPAKSKAKAEPKPKAEKAPKQKAEKAPKAEPAQQPKKQQGLVMEEEEDEAAAKAKAEAERKAAEEAARVEAERKAAEEAAKAEAERKAAEEAARLEAERKAAEEAARVEAERKAAEAAAAAEAARLEAERKAAEEAAAAEAARQEAERLAAEEAAKAEAERLAAEEAAKAAVVVPVVAPVLVEEEQAAPQSSEALKAAEMQAKLDSVLRVQREQEEQLRRLQEQKQAVQTERDREDAALMERARQEAEARAKAKAEAERRAQLEEERRFNEAQVQVNEEPKDKKKKETVFTRYYKHNGQNMLSFLSFGYSTLFVLDGNLARNSADMVFKRHMLSFEAFEWRAKCFGMQLFNFEMGLNTDQYFNGPLYGGANADPKTQTIVNDIQPADAKTMWFAYKPAIKFYIPCTKWMAVELYGGMEVDLCAVWSKINQSYYPVNSLIPAQNFFLSGFGGLGLMFTPTPYVPMELKAEYRHPVKGNTAIVPQGVYLSLQIHLATPTKKR